MRMVRDERGETWRVWHVQPQSAVLIQMSPEMGGGWLCFESDSDKRRLIKPPENWASMTDEELVNLMVTASQVRKAGV